MAPNLKTPKHLMPVLEELRQREPIFHHAELGATRDFFDKMMAPEFWEVGASGQRYSREYALDSLVKRHSVPHNDDWEADDFQCLEIAPDNYLLTYTLIQDGKRMSRRSTIWRRTADGWRIVYHQGTLVERP